MHVENAWKTFMCESSLSTKNTVYLEKCYILTCKITDIQSLDLEMQVKCIKLIYNLKTNKIIIKIAPPVVEILSLLVKTAILKILNVINGFSFLNNPQNHSKIVQIDQVVFELLIISANMLIYANFACKKNCSTYAS